MPHTSHDGNEFLRVVLDAADIGCWEWDVRGRILIGDARCRTLLGLPADAELTPAWLLERVDPLDRERVIAEATRALAGPGAFRSALRLTAADGRVRWFEVRGRAIAGDGEDPTPTRLRGVALLVSDRDPPEYARLFELSVDMLAVASTLDGRWTRVNPAFARTLGWSEAELLATPYLELIHPDDRARSWAAVEPLAGEPVVRFEQRMRCKDGGSARAAVDALAAALARLQAALAAPPAPA